MFTTICRAAIARGNIDLKSTHFFSTFFKFFADTFVFLDSFYFAFIRFYHFSCRLWCSFISFKWILFWKSDGVP